jgi:hypothetical protein
MIEGGAAVKPHQMIVVNMFEGRILQHGQFERDSDSTQINVNSSMHRYMTIQIHQIFETPIMNDTFRNNGHAI